MDHLQMLVLTTGSRDEAVRTLEDIKGLEHAGWIELTDYAVLGPDPQGGVRVYESACAAEPKSLSNGEWSRSLAPAADGFALAVVTAEQYAERVAEELESRGRTVRGHLRGRECRMALRGAVERAKTNLEWGCRASFTERRKRRNAWPAWSATFWRARLPPAGRSWAPSRNYCRRACAF